MHLWESTMHPIPLSMILRDKTNFGSCFALSYMLVRNHLSRYDTWVKYAHTDTTFAALLSAIVSFMDLGSQPLASTNSPHAPSTHLPSAHRPVYPNTMSPAGVLESGRGRARVPDGFAPRSRIAAEEPGTGNGESIASSHKPQYQTFCVMLPGLPPEPDFIGFMQ